MCLCVFTYLFFPPPITLQVANSSKSTVALFIESLTICFFLHIFHSVSPSPWTLPMS